MWSRDTKAPWVVSLPLAIRSRQRCTFSPPPPPSSRGVLGRNPPNRIMLFPKNTDQFPIPKRSEAKNYC
ncbi:hypothetical protein ASPTUDRAFT_48913 [Aspergillus tubingensis CBS 134.48]|uniref:Uncharacterized protein n=2 Tax=Aspergillus subgen. Circumdati TaxID=2720871 RepID=A0A1L9NJ60_ASPTC|nr:hypothetical protein ASPTUDRAFT_48913 [Aspergillus tubingensis CBS 134.48]